LGIGIAVVFGIGVAVALGIGIAVALGIEERAALAIGFPTFNFPTTFLARENIEGALVS
jgi:uncharacterized protein YebE (UPF0316 family)